MKFDDKEPKMDQQYEDFKRQVKDSSDIVDVIAGYLSLQKKGRYYWACCAVRFRDRDIGAPGQCLHRLRESAVFNLLHKRKHIPAGMAAVTIEKLALFVHTEGRGLLAVKRTACPIITSFFL